MPIQNERYSKGIPSVYYCSPKCMLVRGIRIGPRRYAR